MRNPARKALYGLIAFLAGSALACFGALREQRIGEDWTAIAPLLLGLAVAPVALLVTVRALLAALGRARLLAGRDVIARWRIGPGEWERFRALDSRRAAERAELVNALSIRKAIPATGIDVIVGARSLLVDQSYHSLRPGDLAEIGWLAGSPACLEFSFGRRSAEGIVATPVLRIPVAAAASGDGQRVVDHFRTLRNGPD